MQLSHEEQLARRRARYHANPEYVKAQAKAWYHVNADSVKTKKSQYHASSQYKEKRRLYRQANGEKIRIQGRAWRAVNREKVNAKQRARSQVQRLRIRARDRAWAQANPEKIRRRREMNAEKVKACERAWRKKHPERIVTYSAIRRALKRQAAICDFTATQWKAMQEQYQHCCVYCHKRRKGKLSQDHIVPLSKGGNHTWTNIVPACRSCNSRKGNRAILAPIQPVLFLVE